MNEEQPDANCVTLPDGSCVGPDPCMHTPCFDGESSYLPLPERIVTPDWQPDSAASGDVEYEILVPGGGKETVSAHGGDVVPDAMLLARKRLMQLKMLRAMIKKSKRDKKNKEAAVGRRKKSRTKRDAQKASRKKNR